MKLKELPKFWATSRALNKCSVAELHQPSETVLPVIVSLTSIPSRLKIIHLTLRSLLSQQQKPEKIILWLNRSLMQKLPVSLTELEGPYFEIRYSELSCSYRKLIHSLSAFPDKIIVTCDDDLMYDSSWLKRLYADHVQHPGSIIAHACRLIAYKDGELLSYDHWQCQTRTDFTEKWLLPIGCGGVLYPPHCLHEDTTNAALFMKLAPKADDLWFKAMSHLKGTATRRSSEPGNKPVPILGSQKVSLKKTNVRKNGNYDQWRAICDYYQISQ